MDYSIIIYHYPSIIHDPWLKILVDHRCRLQVLQRWPMSTTRWLGDQSLVQDSDRETSDVVGWLRIGMMVRELTDSMHILRSWKFEPFFSGRLWVTLKFGQCGHVFCCWQRCRTRSTCLASKTRASFQRCRSLVLLASSPTSPTEKVER